jgi:Na+/H+ antiporter NhaD/arsenite permease-like protein
MASVTVNHGIMRWRETAPMTNKTKPQPPARPKPASFLSIKKQFLMSSLSNMKTNSTSHPRAAKMARRSLAFFPGIAAFLALAASLLLFPAIASAQAQDHAPPVEAHAAISTAETAHPDAATTSAALTDVDEAHGALHESHRMPHVAWTLPFVCLLLAIALFPLLPPLAHWWEHNTNRLIVSLTLAAITCLYYLLRDFGFHAEPGLPTLLTVLDHAVLKDYIPFIVLLFALYTISGGIRLTGDIPAHPITNVSFLAVGTIMASFIGTTGAAMLLIRPLLQVNSERKHIVHTVIFFIFLVANIGGSLLPIGDPPLFLGYLRGVPFLWTLKLLPIWLPLVAVLLALYWIIDTYAYSKEEKKDLRLDESIRIPMELSGKRNFLLLLGVVLAVAFLVPGKALPGTTYVLPHEFHIGGLAIPNFLRELVQLALAGLSMIITPKPLRLANHFNFHAINEVGALFIGIFITMQVPIEILNIKGPTLGLTTPAQFFWATGLLSSFLDNAPTYVVFFATAGTLPANGMDVLHGLETATGFEPIPLLVAISCGAVFMGAMTYIGNGPNFLVKSIAESRGIKMPSFFGYMLWSVGILVPVFIILTFIFFAGQGAMPH